MADITFFFLISLRFYTLEDLSCRTVLYFTYLFAFVYHLQNSFKSQNLITYLFSNYEAKFNFNSVTSLLNYFLFHLNVDKLQLASSSRTN
jgi:hypothetical protein